MIISHIYTVGKEPAGYISKGEFGILLSINKDRMYFLSIKDAKAYAVRNYDAKIKLIKKV